MALKTFVTDLKEVKEQLHDQYDKTDEGFVLNVDGSDYKKKLSEFRGNNIILRQEQEQIQANLDKFKDIDVAKYKKMQDKLAEIENKELIDVGEFDERMQQRVTTMKADYDGKTAALNTKLESVVAERDLFKSNLDTLSVNDVITKAATKSGSLQSGALTHIHAMARGVWKVNDNGVPVAMDGEKLKYGADGKLPMEADEWIQSVKQSSPYLWKQNEGGSAPGSGGGRMIAGKKMVSPAEALKYQKEIQEGKVGILPD